jgi:hypothetical protein
MMKKWMTLVGSTALCLSQVGVASAAGWGTIAPSSVAALQVGYTPLQDEQSRTVTVMEAVQTRGKVLPYVIGMAAVDIALASLFWGVYVPFYADKEPAH